MQEDNLKLREDNFQLAQDREKRIAQNQKEQFELTQSRVENAMAEKIYEFDTEMAYKQDALAQKQGTSAHPSDLDILRKQRILTNKMNTFVASQPTLYPENSGLTPGALRRSGPCPRNSIGSTARTLVSNTLQQKGLRVPFIIDLRPRRTPSARTRISVPNSSPILQETPGGGPGHHRDPPRPRRATAPISPLARWNRSAP
jgi:hypothetical protein